MVLRNYNDSALDGTVFFAFERFGNRIIKAYLHPVTNPNLYMVQWKMKKDEMHRNLTDTFRSFSPGPYVAYAKSVHPIAYMTQPEPTSQVFVVDDVDLTTIVTELQSRGKLQCEMRDQYPRARYFKYGDQTVLAVVLAEKKNHLEGVDLFPLLVHNQLRIHPTTNNDPSPRFPYGEAFSLLEAVEFDEWKRRLPG